VALRSVQTAANSVCWLGLRGDQGTASIRWLAYALSSIQFRPCGSGIHSRRISTAETVAHPTLWCNRDGAVVGISGQVATVVANLTIACAQMTYSDDRKDVIARGDATFGAHTGRDLGNRVSSVTGTCPDVTRQGSPKPRTDSSGYGTGYDYPKPDVVGHWVARSLLGRSGDLVDQIQLSCDTLPRPMKEYLVKTTVRTATSVPEGTPVVVSAQASGIRPDITPPLQYEWELSDGSHPVCPAPGQLGFCQPSRVSNGISTYGSITLTDLPPAAYQLQITARAASGSGKGSSTAFFEIRENLLISLTLSAQTVRAGTPTTGTVIMEGPAPRKGRVLYLYTSNPNLVPVPSSITVPGGSATGTFSLRPNPAPGSAGEVTISVSTKPPISAKFSTGVQGSIVPRGLEEQSQPDQNSHTTEGQPESDPTLAAVAQQSSGDTEITPQSEVGKRGISPLQMARPSTGIQSAVVTPPAAPSPIMTLPPSQVGAAATQVKPSPQVVPGAAGTLSLPGDTKSAVLSVQLPFGTQLPGK